MYLIQSRAPGSPLYPSGDLKQRGEIDKYLHFELGTLYRALSDVIVSYCYSFYLFLLLTRPFCPPPTEMPYHLPQDPFWKSGEIARSRKPQLEEALQLLDSQLATNNRPFIAGHELSLADLSTFFYLRILAAFPDDIDSSVYLAIQAWQRTVLRELKEARKMDFSLFDEALKSLQEFCRMMRQGIVEF